MKNKITSTLSKAKIISAIKNISMKQKLFTAVSTIPLIVVTNMSGSCATTCPYGMVDDPYPGQCPRYTDIIGEGICDLSQATGAATATDTSTTPDNTITDNRNIDGANPDITIQDQSTDPNTILESSGLDSGNIYVDTTHYFVLPVTIILMGSYLFTHYLFSKGILKQNKHRKIWNLLVTAGYIGTGVTGILLTIMVNLGIRTALNSSITYWHVEMALLMVIGTMIHIHLYWKPFKIMFRVLFGIKSGLRKNLGR